MPSVPPPEINPYASPLVAGGYDSREDEAAGVWRDGPLVVLQKGNVLPPYCVKTGLPVDAWEQATLSWIPPWGLRWRRLKMPVPVSRQWRQRSARLRRLFWLLAAVVGLLFVASLGVAKWFGIRDALPILGPLVVGALIFALAALQQHTLIGIYRVQGEADLIWLAGAGEPFLRQLPRWKPRR